MKRAFPLSLAAAALLAALAGCGQTPPASPAGASSGGPASSWSQDGGARSDASAAPSGGQTAAPSDHSSVSSGGQGEERGIGEQEALAIALDNAGVPSSDASRVKIERDRDNGIPLYDIEFETGYGDYDFQVAMDGGAIVGADYEVDEEHLASGRPAGEPHLPGAGGRPGTGRSPRLLRLGRAPVGGGGRRPHPL